MPRDLGTPGHAWRMQRNCSLAPRQLACAYAVLWCLSFTVALGFALRGYWVILLFSMLEMTAVALALLLYARHAADYDALALEGGVLLVSQSRGGRVRQTRFDAAWTRVVVPARPRDLIWLEGRGARLAVGAFACDGERRGVALELRQRLLDGPAA